MLKQAMVTLASTHNAPNTTSLDGINLRTECWQSRYEDAPYHVVVIRPASADPDDGLCRAVTLEGEDLGWYCDGYDLNSDDEAALMYGRAVIDTINMLAKGLTQ